MAEDAPQIPIYDGRPWDEAVDIDTSIVDSYFTKCRQETERQERMAKELEDKAKEARAKLEANQREAKLYTITPIDDKMSTELKEATVRANTLALMYLKLKTSSIHTVKPKPTKVDSGVWTNPSKSVAVVSNGAPPKVVSAKPSVECNTIGIFSKNQVIAYVNMISEIDPGDMVTCQVIPMADSGCIPIGRSSRIIIPNPTPLITGFLKNSILQVYVCPKTLDSTEGDVIILYIYPHRDDSSKGLMSAKLAIGYSSEYKPIDISRTLYQEAKDRFEERSKRRRIPSDDE
jgi:hypothetical protein